MVLPQLELAAAVVAVGVLVEAAVLAAAGLVVAMVVVMQGLVQPIQAAAVELMVDSQL